MNNKTSSDENNKGKGKIQTKRRMILHNKILRKFFTDIQYLHE